MDCDSKPKGFKYACFKACSAPCYHFAVPLEVISNLPTIIPNHKGKWGNDGKGLGRGGLQSYALYAGKSCKSLLLTIFCIKNLAAFLTKLV